MRRAHAPGAHTHTARHSTARHTHSGAPHHRNGSTMKGSPQHMLPTEHTMDARLCLLNTAFAVCWQAPACGCEPGDLVRNQVCHMPPALVGRGVCPPPGWQQAQHMSSRFVLHTLWAPNMQRPKAVAAATVHRPHIHTPLLAATCSYCAVGCHSCCAAPQAAQTSLHAASGHRQSSLQPCSCCLTAESPGASTVTCLGDHQMK
jgi:hypothetical protein